MTRLFARPRRLAAAIAALGLAVALALIIARSRSSAPSRVLEVVMRTSAGDFAHLFWSGDSGFSDASSIRLALQRTPDTFQTLRFPVPRQGIQMLRFDPMDAAGDVWIGRMRLVGPGGETLATLQPDDLQAVSQIASITSEAGVTHIATTPDATTPSVQLPFACQDTMSLRTSLTGVTPMALAGATAAVLSLLAACFVIIGRTAFYGHDTDPPTIVPSRTLVFLWLAVLFLVVFSAKLLLMRGSPVTAPFWDQWDGELAVLFTPYHQCRLDWRAMVGFHNEHRVLFTRLLALDLFALNGQWDPRLEQVANAVLHALTGVLLATGFWIANGRRRIDFLVFICALTFALPFGWENTLGGFQSAFYFLLLFSMLALWLTADYAPGTPAWWFGWLCAACAIFTAASGLLIAPVIAVVALMKWIGETRAWRGAAANLAAAAAVLGVGAAAASPPVAYHAYLKAASVTEFVAAFNRALAWPWIDQPRFSLVMWLPLLALVPFLVLKRFVSTKLERVTVGLSVWVILNAAALAYGRGAGAGVPATRYLDFLSLGFIANVMALLAILDRARGPAMRGLGYGSLGAWLVFAVVGIDALTSRALGDLSVWRQYFITQAATLREYMITGNRADFMAKRPLVELPYPDPTRLVTLLQDGYTRRILPAAVRRPLHVEPQTITNQAFVTDSPWARRISQDPLVRTWWSLSEQGRKARGRFESRPMVCQAGSRLKVEVSGYLGWKNEYLALRNLQTGRDTVVTPPHLAREGWADAVARCPAEPFQIVAVDDASDSWFGFREPVEIGAGSLVAESLIGVSRGLLFAGLAMAVLIVRWT